MFVLIFAILQSLYSSKEKTEEKNLGKQLQKLKQENFGLKEELFRCKTEFEMQTKDFKDRISQMEIEIGTLKEENEELNKILNKFDQVHTYLYM